LLLHELSLTQLHRCGAWVHLHAA